jgi:transposase/putative transposase
MKGKRRRHGPEFKARVALEAIKGVKIIQEIAEEFEHERAQLHAKIGQQAVELDWLTKKSKQLGL